MTTRQIDPDELGHAEKAISDLEEAFAALQAALACGHRAIDHDDSYGGCSYCTLKAMADRVDTAEASLGQIAQYLAPASCSGTPRIHCMCVYRVREMVAEYEEQP